MCSIKQHTFEHFRYDLKKQANYYPFSRESYICQESEWEHTTITITITTITPQNVAISMEMGGKLQHQAISFYFLAAALHSRLLMFLKTISCSHHQLFGSVCRDLGTNQPILRPNFTPLSLLIFLFLFITVYRSLFHSRKQLFPATKTSSIMYVECFFYRFLLSTAVGHPVQIPSLSLSSTCVLRFQSVRSSKQNIPLLSALKTKYKLYLFASYPVICC